MSAGDPESATQRNGPFLRKTGADVLGHKAGNIEGVFDAGPFSLGPDIVPVIKRHGTHLFQRQHGGDVLAHGRDGSFGIFLGIGSAQRQRIGQRHSIGDITPQRIMGAGLIGQDVGHNARRASSGITSAQLPTRPNGRASRPARILDHCQGLSRFHASGRNSRS